MSDKTANSADGGTGAEEPKKLSQAEAIKRILEKKKQAQQQANGQQGNNSSGPKKMKTQIHKVQNNQKRRTGV
ncbi:hypothetical protein [Cohnella luojiensis]|uniref:Uncharacterized protein n=1 Tax=Cohnella luojiensis TaxID=652876 RepID=A0A4Y8LR19_9BACL|nr:hypothetical protein [Cohnella luojiensis]TFE23318.1 hypothetical protein E2980_19625 [Cohnella luojiensis]